MHSTKNNSSYNRTNIPVLSASKVNHPTTTSHRRAASSPFPFPTLTSTPTPATQPYHSTPQRKDLYQQALERSTSLSSRSPYRPINTGAISSHAKLSAPQYLDTQSSDYWYYYNYYNQPKMAAYPRDIPSWTNQAAYYYTTAPASHIPHSSPPRALMAPRSSPSAYEQLPTAMPVIPESYMHQTFRDFASHAYRCNVCYDPMQVFLDGRQLCSKGNKYARKVQKALQEEANKKYHRSKSSRRRADGYQSIEVEIPNGCEVVRVLINVMERGFDISGRAEPSASVPATPITPTRTYFDDAMYAHYQQRRGPASDEELYSASRSRSRHREELGTGRSRSTKRSSSVGNAGRKPVVVGIEERERRPYGGTHSSNGSTDSGYDTAPGSPDNFRRGSQYAEDMKRRKERPKSILKKSVSFEREHLLEKDPQTPRSPTKGTNQEKYVFFNISGECLAPGYD